MIAVAQARSASRLRVFAAFPAAYWYIVFGTAINGLATFVLPFEMLYLTSVRGLPVPEAALFLSLYGVGSCLAGLFGGWLSDRIGRRPVLLWGMLLLAITTLALGFASAPMLIAVLSFFCGFWTSTYRPAAQAAIADLIPSDQQSLANTITYWGYNLGIAASPVLASVMIHAAGYSLIFAADGVGTLIFCGLIFFFVPESRPQATSVATASHERAARPGTGGVWRDGFFLGFVVLIFAIACLYFQSTSTVPVDMSLHGMNVSQYGLALSTNGLAVIVLTLPLSRLFTRWSPFRALAISAVLMGFGFGLMALAGSLHSLLSYIASVLIWTLGEIIYSPSSATVVAQIAPADKRGVYQGVFRAGWGLASFAGPALGGLLLAHAGLLLWVGCVLMGLLIALGFSLFGLIHQRQRVQRLQPLRTRYKWLVELSLKQRMFLQRLLASPGLSAYQRLHAHIILQSDCNGAEAPRSIAQIASALAVGRSTVIRTRRRYVEQGMEAMFETRSRNKAHGRGALSPQRKTSHQQASSSCSSRRLRLVSVG